MTLVDQYRPGQSLRCEPIPGGHVKANPILAQLGSYAITELTERAKAMRAAGMPVVDFSIGDPREPTPAFIPEALRNSVPEISQYPSTYGTAELREAIAEYVERRFGVAVDPDTEVQPTTGSKESIFSTPLAFVDRDEASGVIWPSPGYPIYERGALLAGATPYPTVLGEGFVARPEDASDEAWDSSVLAWVCTPHNPTGSVMAFDDLAAFHARARSADVLLCSDECYADLYEGDPPHSILEVEGTKGVLSYLSLSKRSGMTGYRSGAIVGDADAIAIIRSLRTATGTAPTEFVSAAAVAAWSDDEHAVERRAIFAEKRAIVRDAFAELGYDTVASDAGLYSWIRVGDDVAMAERLLDGGIVVTPGRAFGPGGEGFIRLALVPTIEATHEAVKVVKECLTES